MRIADGFADILRRQRPASVDKGVLNRVDKDCLNFKLGESFESLQLLKAEHRPVLKNRSKRGTVLSVRFGLTLRPLFMRLRT